MDFARARIFMVDGQLRPNQVQDPRILSALVTCRERRLSPPASRRAPMRMRMCRCRAGGR